MKKYILAILAVFVLVTLIPAVNSYAQHKMKRQENFHGRGKIWEQLNLTKEQKDQIDKFRMDHQKEAIDIRAQIQKNRVDIKELLKSANLDEGKIRSLVNKNSDLQAKLKESALDMFFNSYKVLDDKQKEIIREHAPALLGGGFMRGMRHGDGMGMGILKHSRTFRHETGENGSSMLDD